MPRGLVRFQESGTSHFVTFSCDDRQMYFNSPEICDLFVDRLESMRRRFVMRVYGYVVMPEHVHLLMSEPEQALLADALHFLKLSFTKQLNHREESERTGSFWEKRYHDRHVRDAEEFQAKLRYLHRNPVKRGLVPEAIDWKWSSFRHYALREIGVVEIESEWTARDRETERENTPPRVFLCPG